MYLFLLVLSFFNILGHIRWNLSPLGWNAGLRSRLQHKFPCLTFLFEYSLCTLHDLVHLTLDPSKNTSLEPSHRGKNLAFVGKKPLPIASRVCTQGYTHTRD